MNERAMNQLPRALAQIAEGNAKAGWVVGSAASTVVPASNCAGTAQRSMHATQDDSRLERQDRAFLPGVQDGAPWCGLGRLGRAGYAATSAVKPFRARQEPATSPGWKAGPVPIAAWPRTSSKLMATDRTILRQMDHGPAAPGTQDASAHTVSTRSRKISSSRAPIPLRYP